MRIAVILLFGIIIHVGATTVYSQTTSVSLNLRNTTVEKVLNTIEESSEFYFLYNSKLIDVDRQVNLQVKNQSIETVLKTLFGSTDVDYKIEGKQIILSNQKLSQPDIQQVSQQNTKKITGQIKDVSKEPVIGVNVSVKGTSNGSITDIDGGFMLNVPSGSTLAISYIGYLAQEIVVGERTNFEITLLEDNKMLDEVVVVGYGTQRKKDVTGSISSLNNEVITKQNAINATVALRGQVPGLSIQQNNGRAGGESTVILRGQSAIGKTVQPLVVIDGTPSDWSVLNNMDSQDIERIDVLKDASSTAIYGSRASGGVIIVTTRVGYEAKNTVTYSGNVGIKKLARNPKMMNTQQFYQFYQDGVAFRGEPQDSKIMADDQEYINRGINTDWLDLITRDGMQTSHNISLSGGNKAETHYMSMGYFKEEGIQKSEGYERFSMNARITGNIGGKFTAGASLYASYAVNRQGDQNMLSSAYRLRPWGNPYNEDGSYRFYPTQNETLLVNPVFDLENTFWERKRLQARGNAFLEYKPIEGITLKSSFMPNFEMRRTGNYTGEMTQANAGKEGTSKASAENLWGVGYLWENTVNYTRKVNEDHSIAFTGLFSIEDRFEEQYNGLVQNLTYENEYWYNFAASTSINSLTSKYTNTAMISYMGRVNYSFREKYLLTLTGRWDGSSKFAPGNKWGFFPSAALAWRLGEEDFIKKMDLFSNLKLRLSYGVAGNNAVDPYSSFATLSTTIYAWDETAAKGSSASMANRGLGWEKSYEYNLGLDMGFFNERLTASIDIYHKTTKDLILNRQIPSHQGVTQLSQNVGSVRNKGIELTINSLNIKTNDFSWRTSLNFSTNKNEILELYGDKVDDIGNGLFIGQPVKVSYDYKYLGIWQLGEEDEAKRYGARPGYVKISDVDNSGSLTPEADKLIVGNPFPKWTGGITNTFTYKDFDLSFFIYTRQGEFVKSGFHNDMVSDFQMTRYNIADVSYWTPSNPTNKWPAAGSPNSNTDKAYYMDCSFWKVGHITLGYEFNKKVLQTIGLSNLRTYIQVNNPFVFTKYDGWDPEWADKGANAAPLNGVTYLMGLNISF